MKGGEVAIEGTLIAALVAVPEGWHIPTERFIGGYCKRVSMNAPLHSTLIDWLYGLSSTWLGKSTFQTSASETHEFVIEKDEP